MICYIVECFSSTKRESGGWFSKFFGTDEPKVREKEQSEVEPEVRVIR